MIPFDILYNEFENTNDICSFCSIHRENRTAERFLLIRSLDKPNLQDIIRLYSSDTPSGNMRALTRAAYESAVTVDGLLDYIEQQRTELVSSRRNELNGLEHILEDNPVVNCGIRNDKVDDIVKQLVRNKEMKSFEELEEMVTHSVMPRIRQYILWSYYNQTANDLIEMYFISHPAVIPTLRKIHDIDFFLYTDAGNEIIPFDLKFTHISDAYFDLFSKGLTPLEAGHDDFLIGNGIEEIKEIKAYYSKRKAALSLPNYGSMSKKDLLDTLSKTGAPGAAGFIRAMEQKRSLAVEQTARDLRALEWWNYKFQGKRLFCNNNRFFVFLAWKERFTDGRELKGRIHEIGRKITTLLDCFSSGDIHTIRYHYDKEAGLSGNYTARTLSTIYCE